ncbi:serine/threonine-protein kinase [Variovorax sp. KK3]|uniref:serine/threonine protein kinase n=1 Tax=Variovorax sp. KK3 TaxID=1855728 RepID=UPI00097C1C0A|nr:serine/threonine-protein kinase [Variovorax sp. KK3]
MDTHAAYDLPTLPGPPTQCGDWAMPPHDWSDFERESARVLPEGARLQDYEIAGPIGEGGFGIVYLAWDPAKEQHVAIKEYMPAVLAARDQASAAVIVRSPRHDDNFRIGLRSFLNEARILQRFDHRALVRVLHYWEGNGTAYMAMPYYQGPTLARALADLGRPPSEDELRGWLRPLLDALATLHDVHCLHRDIAPDNILLTEEGPVLLDFGAARRVIDGAGQSPTLVFKPGFTPLEQYAELATMRQGPWTDLYALAAVVYTAIAGQPPVSSVEREPDDPLRPLSTLARGRYSAPFLATIDAALALHPKDRPQNAAAFWEGLVGRDRVVAQPDAQSESKSDAKAEADPAEPPASRKVPDVDAKTVAPPSAAEMLRALHAPQRAAASATPRPASSRAAEVFAAAALRAEPSASPEPSQRGRMGWWAMSGALVLAGLAVAGYYRIGDPVQTVAPLAVPASPRTLPAEPVPAAKSSPSSTPTPVARAEARAQPTPIATTPPASSPAFAPVLPSVVIAAPPAPAPMAADEVLPLQSMARPDASWSPAPPAPAAPVAKPAARTPTEPVRLARREPRAPVAEAAAPRAEPRQAALAHAEAAPPAGRCSDLLQRASLGTLGPGEVALLRKGCE